MFEAQEVSARPALVGVITDCSSLAFLTPSLWECSPLCGHLTTLVAILQLRLRRRKNWGGPWDRHQIPIVKRETNCFMAELFKSCLGHQFYYELTGTLQSIRTSSDGLIRIFIPGMKLIPIMFHLGPDSVTESGGGSSSQIIASVMILV